MKRFLVIFSVFTFFANHAGADFYLHPWMNQNQPKQRLEVVASGNYYTTTQNFDSYGTLRIPSQFQKYSRAGADLSAAFGILDRLTVFGNFSWIRAQVDTTQSTGSSFGLADQSVGANYRVLGNPSGHPWSRISLDLQLRFDFPAYSNSSADLNQSPWLGDGSQDFTTGGFLTVPLVRKGDRTLLLQGGAGYTYRTGGFSSAIPWSTGLQFNHPRTGWLVSLGLSGIYSLKKDTTLPLVGTQRSVGTSGSFITNAINPSLTQVSGQLGYRIDSNLDAFVGALQGLAGENAPQGLLVYGGVQFRLGGTSGGSTNPALLAPAEYGKSNQGFVNYQGVQAKVVRTNDRLNIVKLDKGSSEGIELGNTFDVFIVKPNQETGEAVARGKITQVKPDEAILSITEYFKEVWIDEGFVARRPIE